MKNDKKFIVYIHKCPNNKVYIGITSQEAKRRWDNGNGYKNNKYFINAIKKYGWNNIEHKILFTNLTKKEAEQKEKELIKKYKTNIREYGYNILSGGNISNGITKEVSQKMSKNMKAMWQNKEYKAHMIKAHTGKKASKETREKMSKNNARIWLGKNISEEMKQKISDKKKGCTTWNKGTKGAIKANKTSFKKGEVHSITKKVKCLETQIIYNTINSASKELNINATCIINVCKGKQNVAGGYHWEYI